MASEIIYADDAIVTGVYPVSGASTMSGAVAISNEAYAITKAIYELMSRL